MNTRLVMTGAALFTALMGIAFLFWPDEVFRAYGTRSEYIPELLIQLGGALFLGFAAINWISRGSLLGGIYGRSLVAGNFMHFAIGSVLSIKEVVIYPCDRLSLLGLLVYLAFGVAFGILLFRSPAPKEN